MLGEMGHRERRRWDGCVVCRLLCAGLGNLDEGSGCSGI